MTGDRLEPAEVRCKCFIFFFSSRRRHTRFDCDWSSDVCSSDLPRKKPIHDASMLTADQVSRWAFRRSRASRISRSNGVSPSGAGATGAVPAARRSEERRVGKKGRYRWAPDHLKKKKLAHTTVQP